MLRLSVKISRKLLRSNRDFQKLKECKFSRLVNNSTNVFLRNNSLNNVYKHSRVHRISVVRYQSTVDSSTKTTVPSISAQQAENTIGNVNVNVTEVDKGFISEIPDVPVPPPSEELINVVSEVLHANGEPTFTSLGLGGYGPVGIMQYSLELLHIGCDLPWWAAITVITVIVKALSVPLVINSNKNSAKMQTVIPQLVALQEKMTTARNCGNEIEVAVHSAELQTLLKKNDVSLLPVTNIVLRILLHVPVFMGLREMANLPVESLKTGGLWWFTDLTITDPYYLLPLFTSVGLFLVTEHSLKSASTLSPLMQYMMRGVPVLTFAFAINFPGAILCYWVLSTFMTVAQNIVLNNPKVRKYFNIPPPKVHKKQDDSVLKKKGFIGAFNETFTNYNISRKLSNRLYADEMQFNAAAKGPLKKTFKYNPVTGPPKETSVKRVAAIKK
ncbi:mitochondrial inner membrane protein OXA1L [Osmia bicornis bicornis]|uniref:mitochondrial inner membrane protein OXA1L n=1 Tax=Osmia bicornis bicornis TaxID=1437191 RepID=UPI0010F63511|nr:mitochondrial inner membrane protein OXA1L [Osmia bicornis bicornis]